VLYNTAGLNKARSALSAGGVLAVWSARPNTSFAQRLRKTGFDLEEVKVRANGSRGGAKHIIWVATRTDRKH
jgi:spermidine synthase